jgi:hypothetical protein
MYQLVRKAKKRDFASFQHHEQVFRQAIVEGADNQVLLPQRTSRYEKSSRLFRSARLFDVILVFRAGSGPGPSASRCADPQGPGGQTPHRAEGAPCSARQDLPVAALQRSGVGRYQPLGRQYVD